MIAAAIATVTEGRDLSRGEARAVMTVVMSGEATPAQIAGLLVGLSAKGETSDEITGFAEAMAELVVPVTPARAPLVDVVIVTFCALVYVALPAGENDGATAFNS